ncbi:dioxygenase [Chroococcidiopsis sp. CCALA 051]|uniref:dioxygenase family protein n=1 Tax=Chroococcidiopsis sp. CCALA 051 TaxID=869949 RepID=UPI0018EB067A|nr:dioxygenase [Chroococcidiopsis sp. CCALA 051]
MQITLDNITQAVINHGDGGKAHPRLYEIYRSLIAHLHAFVKEVNLTEQELQLGRDFLNRASHHTQEIHMLTDLIGISELVELLHDTNGKATESNLEGPMYVLDAPERNMGDRLGIDKDGEPLIVSGYVLDLDGKPIADAIVDVWQPNSQGLYDLQDPSQPKDNFRGRLKTKVDGIYTFETVVPTGYHIPASGPCGEVLELLGRHTWRAAHIHFKLSAPGYTPLTTQIFIAGDPHIDSDTTFSVKTAIASLQKHDAVDELMASGRHVTFYTTNFNFVLR